MIVSCPNCGLKFESNVINLRNAVNVKMYSNKVSCPRCGEMANLADGIYNFDNQGNAIKIANMLRNANISQESLRQLMAVLEQTNKNQTSDEFKEKINQIDPIIGSILKTVIPKEPSAFWTFIAALIAAIQMLINNNSSTPNIANNYIINSDSKYETYKGQSIVQSLDNNKVKSHSIKKNKDKRRRLRKAQKKMRKMSR